MRVIKFGKEAFRTMNTRRAPGADKKRIQYGYASDRSRWCRMRWKASFRWNTRKRPRACRHRSRGGAVNMVLDVIDLGHEIEAAGIARNAGNYDANHKLALTGADRWTDPNSDPKADFDAAKEIIRRSIGRYPNTLTLGPNAAMR